MRVIVNFQNRKGWWIHTIAEDCRTTLGPHLHVASEATLLRLFRYLGATDAAMEQAERELRMWSRGGIHIEVPEDRLALLRVSYKPAAAQLPRKHPNRVDPGLGPAPIGRVSLVN